MSKALLDRHGFAHAICNCLYRACRSSATSIWRRRLRARSMTGSGPNGSTRTRACGPPSSCRRRIAELAVEEIERCAPDQRFVQVLLLAMGEHPLGQSQFWPIHRAAERHGLTIGIHAGSSYHHAVTGSGWPSYYLEDYAAQSLGFHTQLGSLIAEGVFVKFPKLKVVLIESGVTLDRALSLAAVEVLARRAQRGAVDRPLAQRVRARPCSPDHPAV